MERSVPGIVPGMDYKKLQESIAAGSKELVANQMRDRSPTEAPEAPILIKKEIKVEDDNHTILCWEFRRLYKQPNLEPKLYWKEAKYQQEIRPNLQGSLYTDHLTPMSLSAKAVGWLHSIKKVVAIKYYTTK